MTSASKRARGKVEELSGKAKAKVGKLLGNEQMQAEGAVRALKGKVKQELVKAGERAKGKVEQVAGRVKKRIGGAIKNEQMQAEGKLKELKGSARQRINK